MASNGYEIRLTLLQMAKDMAYEGWHAKQNAAFHKAEKTSSALEDVPPPSFAEIEDLAHKLYGFVQERGDAANIKSPTWANKLKWVEHDEPEIGVEPLRNPSLYSPETK